MMEKMENIVFDRNYEEDEPCLLYTSDAADD